MSEAHYFSLRTTSDKLAIMVMMAVGGAGMFVVTPPLAFLAAAIVSGMLFGVADSWHFLDTKWPRAIAAMLLVMLSAMARDKWFAKLGSGAHLLAMIQFVASAIISAMMIVQLKELVIRKRNRG